MHACLGGPDGVVVYVGLGVLLTRCSSALARPVHVRCFPLRPVTSRPLRAYSFRLSCIPLSLY